MHEGLKLQYLPADVERLEELVEFLKFCIQGTPCLVARPGETTYECRVEHHCVNCRWRHEVNKLLIDEWDCPNGIW